MLIRITLRDYADIRVNTNRVYFRFGVTYKFSATYCIDIENIFWEPVSANSCKFSDYSVLYRVWADRIFDNMNEQAQTVYSLTAQNTIFALTSTGKYPIYDHILIRTEKPKLIFFEKLGISFFKLSSRMANLDIFTYINLKFIYVEKGRTPSIYIPVSLYSRLPTASFAHNILPTALFAYIPDFQQSDCLQAIIVHI